MRTELREAARVLRKQVDEARDSLETAIDSREAKTIETARARFQSLQDQWMEAVGTRIEIEGEAVGEAPTSLEGATHPLPEPGASGVGVAISGGGTRSLSAAMGQLRGLRHLGLLDKVSHLSSVSGGTWASVLYTYLRQEISDDVFLGEPVLDPAELTWSFQREAGESRALNRLSSQALGSAATRIGLKRLLKEAVDLREHYEDSPHVLWLRAIGNLILAPFGLGDGPPGQGPLFYYSSTSEEVAKIVEQNPALSPEDFYTIEKPNRPKLVTNSTVFFPPSSDTEKMTFAKLMASEAELYPFEATPTAAGIPGTFPGDGVPNPPPQPPRGLGGGLVDPFTFGGAAPSSVNGQRYTVPTPPGRFSLSDVAGLSSAAFVGALAEENPKLDFLDKLIPVVGYWPVLQIGTPGETSYPYFFGDGGNLENTGIMALLRRGFKRVIAFVNSSTPLDRKGDQDTVVVSGQLPPLFGLNPFKDGGYTPIEPASREPFRNNQVFPQERFQELLTALWDAHQAGGTALFRQDALPVQDNPRFGISGAPPVDVLWVYNNPVTFWEQNLRRAVRKLMRLNFLDFKDFPNYKTILQLHLDKRQVNLMAHLSTWNVASTESVGGQPANASVFQGMFE